MIEHVLVGVALAARPRRRLPDRPLAPAPLGHPDSVHHILLPFTGTEISRRALDAALRLARAEDATLMPAYLAAVPLQLPLECAMPERGGHGRCRCWRRSNSAPAPRGWRSTPASSAAAPTATRSSACSTRRRFDRVVVAAHANGGEGLSGDDLVWLLRKAPAEVLILRPAPDDQRRLSVAAPV